MNKYTCQVSLTVLGPFLTAAAGPQSYGVDRSFHRNYLGRLVVPASHIKGKLRMSLEEIHGFMERDRSVSLVWLFGTPSGNHGYEPNAGGLRLSDFVIESGVEKPEPEKEKAPSKPNTRTRTAIEAISGTAAQHQLRVFEDQFPSGKEICCTGEISFQVKDLAGAQVIANMVRLGFTWLTSMGSEKGVGFGRLKAVQVSNPKETDTTKITWLQPGTGEALTLRIRPREPIAAGGVQKRRTNYAQSELILPGGSIKGALASCLNRAFDIEPVYQELDQKSAKRYNGFEKLVEHFSRIRITHAFPACKDKERPVRMPISVASFDDRDYDAALSAQPVPMKGGSAPFYFIDWKKPREYFGAANPQEIFLTHTEIDDHSRRSLHGNLFTESYLCPRDEEGQPVEWVSNVDFWEIEDPDERKQAALEFCKAMQLYFDGLGRENRRVEVSISEGYATPFVRSKGLVVDNTALVTLQSDALILDPQAVRALRPGEDLHGLYAGFWEEVSKNEDGYPCLELVDFFAHQSFKGGYLYHRYLGAAERNKKTNNYRPYYLTNAGSLFNLRVTDRQKAEICLKRWTHQGLDLPNWATKEYGKYKRALWKNCPFVPENGYGEVAVNLEWHWEHDIEK